MENIQAPIPNTRWNFCGPPLFGFPDAAENAVSNVVGQLIYVQSKDHANDHFEWIYGRPDFISLTKSVFSEKYRDRCHSVSWESLLSITIDLLYDATGAGLQYFTNSMLSMSLFWSPAIRVFCAADKGDRYRKQLEICSRNLIKQVQTQNPNPIALSATSFLTTLNSCIYNLRYPDCQSYHWNQSVGSAYDPCAWFFVNESKKVVNDQTGVFSQPKDFSEYGPLHGHPVPSGPGFYLPSLYDTCMFNRLYSQSLTSYLHSVHIFINHGVDADGHFIIPSSSNRFSRQDLNPDRYSVYRESGGKWVLF